jgi:hypothetical protein
MEIQQEYIWSFYINDHKIIKVEDIEPNKFTIYRFSSTNPIFQDLSIEDLNGRICVDCIKDDSEIVYNRLQEGIKLKDLM